MSARYMAVRKTDQHVLSSPSELLDPETRKIACSIWSWVPDPERRRAHHFNSRADAKEVLRAIGEPLGNVSFRKAA